MPTSTAIAILAASFPFLLLGLLVQYRRTQLRRKERTLKQFTDRILGRG